MKPIPVSAITSILSRKRPNLCLFTGVAVVFSLQCILAYCAYGWIDFRNCFVPIVPQDCAMDYGRLSGLVQSESGNPIPDAQIEVREVYPANCPEEVVATTETNQDGLFDIGFSIFYCYDVQVKVSADGYSTKREIYQRLYNESSGRYGAVFPENITINLESQ